VEILREIRMARGKRKATVAVFREDVFHDGAGLGEHEVAVGDHRGGSDRMQRLVGRRRQHGLGIARGVLELIGNAELLAEPDDPFRLRFAEMMDGKHERPPKTLVRALLVKEEKALAAMMPQPGGQLNSSETTRTRGLAR